jgi:hypothetical protein
LVGGRRTDADDYSSAGPVTVPDDWVMVVGVLDYANRTITFYRNGEQTGQTTGAWTAGGNTSNTTSSDDVTVGAFSSLSSTFNGRIAEVGCCVALPTEDEVDRLFGYMAHRWGLADNLPVGHPYKALPPTA